MQILVSVSYLRCVRACRRSQNVRVLGQWPLNNNNNNNNETRTIFLVLSSWPQAIARVHSVHLCRLRNDLYCVEWDVKLYYTIRSFDELQNSAQAAVDPQTKPPNLGCESACRQLSSTTTIAIYYEYQLFGLRKDSARKADTHLPSHVG